MHRLSGVWYILNNRGEGADDAAVTITDRAFAFNSDYFLAIVLITYKIFESFFRYRDKNGFKNAITEFYIVHTEAVEFCFEDICSSCCSVFLTLPACEFHREQVCSVFLPVISYHDFRILS